MKINESRSSGSAVWRLAAFLIPFGGLLVIMIAGGYQPFGHYSMLYSDMYHQYYPFFVAYRKALLSGQSMLYTWSTGLGMDYLSLISYYLASPLNLLSVLVPEKWLLGYFSLLVPIKLGLASLFFSLFLEKTFGRKDYSVCLFGAFYGLCAWALGYQWNVMWLDGFALLPLVALGTVGLLRDKKCILYTVSLFFAVGINYYIGFFVCIFVALLFFCWEICRWRGIGRFFADLARIAFFSLLALGMTAFLTVPAYLGLQTTQSSVNAFPKGFRLNIASANTLKGFLDAMRRVAGNAWGGIEPTFKEGLPNLYCGTVSGLLAVLYLGDRETRLRDKLCAVFLLLFFMVSFILRQLDYIWHGFHFTNMIPYRFSFLWSFVVLYMAYRAYTRRFRFRLWQIVGAALIAAGLMYCSDNRADAAFLAFNGIALVLGTGLLALGAWERKIPAAAEEDAQKLAKKADQLRRKLAALGLCAVMGLELVANLVNFGVRFPPTNVSNYPKGTADTAEMVSQMRDAEAGTLFYRAETTHSQTLNDGALIGYNGVTTFTSSANVRVTEFMQCLGFGAKNTYNRYCFEEASPVANLFLNLKYMLERDGNVENNQFFDIAGFSGRVYLLRNNAYLPLGFLAEPELADVDFNVTNTGFDFQNQLFSAATGMAEDVWDYTPDAEVTARGASLGKSTTKGKTFYTDKGEGGSVSFFFTAQRNGFMCISLELPSRNSYTVYLNDEALYTETVSLPQQSAVSDVCAGDVVEVRVITRANENSSMTIRAAVTDSAVFRDGVANLRASTLELTDFSTTRVTGTIDCDRDGLLYTSIPQDGNWHAYVDGVEAEITLVGNAMCGIPLTRGHHELRFVYRNEAFQLGAAVSGVCAAVLLAYAALIILPRRKRGKYDK